MRLDRMLNRFKVTDVALIITFFNCSLSEAICLYIADWLYVVIDYNHNYYVLRSVWKAIADKVTSSIFFFFPLNSIPI